MVLVIIMLRLLLGFRNCRLYSFYKNDSYITKTLTTSDYFGISSISQYQVVFNADSGSMYRFNFQNNTFTSVKLSGEVTLYCPFLYLNYIDPFVSDYCSTALESLNNNDLSTLIALVTSTNQKLDDVNEELGELNDFISDTSSNDSSYNQTSTSVTDNTSNKVDTIFTDFQNALTSDDYAVDVVLPIPFTNKNITIPSNFVKVQLNKLPGHYAITSIIEVFWWYVIGRFIIKDILKYIDNLKSGDILKNSDTNIKADML